MSTPPRLAPALLAGLLLTATPAPAATDDVQDVVYFNESRPVLIRMHLRADGKPHVARWEGFLRKLHAFLDRDDDGTLDEEEARRAPLPQQLAGMMQTGNPFYFAAGARPTFAEMDADRDGEVSAEEFVAYYRRSVAGPVQVAPYFNPSVYQDALTDTLFAHLDTNKDGKLSRAELLAAPAVLGKYDLDDDEVVTAQELTPPGGLARPGAPARLPRRRGRVVGQPVAPLFLVPPLERGQRAARGLAFAKAVLDHYDQDRDQKLSRKEIGLSREAFARLDRNRDGLLDSLELMRWPVAVPDAEVVIRLGAAGGRKGPQDLVAPVGGAKGQASLRRASASTASLTLGNTRVNLVRGPSPVYGAGMRPYLMQQFKVLDKGKKGFITAEQVKPPQYAFFRGILDMADRDGDGKMTAKELTAWQDLMDGANVGMVSITFGDTGRGLFQMLDADRDGRLSVRELRAAWARLKEFDGDKDGRIARGQLPRQVQITVNRGGPNYARPFPGAVPPRPRRENRGPLWFRKMDTNGDGDVSRREFLGGDADFRKIDADGDGLLSAAEAECFDAALRGKATKAK